MIKPNFTNELINWKTHYLALFEEVVKECLVSGKAPEEIISFTQDLSFDIIGRYGALTAGINKFTTKEERQKVLLKLDKK